MFYFPIEVHSWGGLGSQLCALAFTIDLKNSAAKRAVKLCHHSSGVTRRELELPSLDLFGIEQEFVDDFQPLNMDAPNHANSNLGLGKRLVLNQTKTAKHLVDRAGFVILRDPPDNLVKPWSLQIRSTYSNRKISQLSLEAIVSLLFSESPSANSSKSCLVHLRLGDLMSLATKSPLDMNRVADALRISSEKFPDYQIEIATDSPEVLNKLLVEMQFNKSFAIFRGSATKTLLNLGTSSVLVASSSKLSIWGILVGIELGVERTVYIPTELMSTIRLMAPRYGRTKFVEF